MKKALKKLPPSIKKGVGDEFIKGNVMGRVVNIRWVNDVYSHTDSDKWRGVASI